MTPYTLPHGTTVIIHGAKIPGRELSPKRRDEALGPVHLWGTTRCNTKFWGGRLKDWDAWTDVHPLVKTADFAGIPQRRPETWRWYLEQDGTRPIFLQAPEAHPVKDQEEALRLFNQVPGARRFPIDDIRRRFMFREGDGPHEPARYFFCQVGMMMAHAASLGAQRVILNGIGMPQNIPHQHLHRDIGYWLGFLRGAGVEVWIDGPSTFRAPEYLYAYDRHHFKELAGMREGLEEREDDIRERIMKEVRRGRPVPRFPR